MERGAPSRPSATAHAPLPPSPSTSVSWLRPGLPGPSSTTPPFSPFSVLCPLGGLCVHPTLGAAFLLEAAFVHPAHLLTSAETCGHRLPVWVPVTLVTPALAVASPCGRRLFL